MGGTFRIQNSTSFIYNETYGFGDPRLKKPPYIDQNHENVNVDRDYSDLQCFFLVRVCVCEKGKGQFPCIPWLCIEDGITGIVCQRCK